MSDAVLLHFCEAPPSSGVCERENLQISVLCVCLQIRILNGTLYFSHEMGILVVSVGV